MAASDLTAARLRELLHYDPETGIFTNRTRRAAVAAGSVAGSVGNGGYLRVFLDGIRYPLHRLAWLYVHGEWPNFSIDHMDGNPGNNRISNLRDVNQSTNMENVRRARSDNSSGVLGVCWCKHYKKWKASIRVKGVLRHIKYTHSKEEAEQAYLEAKRRLHAGCTI